MNGENVENAQNAGQAENGASTEHRPGRVVRVGRRRVLSGSATQDPPASDPHPPETLDETQDGSARDTWLEQERPPHWD